MPWYSEMCSSTLAATYSSGAINEKQVNQEKKLRIFPLQRSPFFPRWIMMLVILSNTLQFSFVETQNMGIDNGIGTFDFHFDFWSRKHV